MSNIVKNPIIVTSGGGSGTLMSKNVTENLNGSYTYSAKNDHVDGYSSITITTSIGDINGYSILEDTDNKCKYLSHYDSQHNLITQLIAIDQDITSLTIRDDCTSIYQVDFSVCPSLKTLILPEGIKDISCKSGGLIQSLQYLENIYYKGSVKQLLHIYTIDALPKITKIYTKKESSGPDNNDLEQDFELLSCIDIIPDAESGDELSINFDFDNYNYLTRIQLGSASNPFNSISLVQASFTGCRNLETLTIYSNSVGVRNFGGSGLKTVSIHFGWYLGIASYTFGSCSLLENVNLIYHSEYDPEHIQTRQASIQSYAFNFCIRLKTLDLSDLVLTQIYDHTFQDCIELHEIILPATITSIGERAFFDCRLLTTFTIPANVTNIGNQAFDNSYVYEVINLSELPITIGSTDYGYIAYYAQHVIQNASESTITKQNGLIVDNNNGYKTLIGVYSYNNNYSYTAPSDIDDIILGLRTTKDFYQFILPAAITTSMAINLSDCVQLAEVINYANNVNIQSYSNNTSILTDGSQSTLSVIDHCICAHNTVFGFAPGDASQELVLTDNTITKIASEAFSNYNLWKIDLIQTSIDTIQDGVCYNSYPDIIRLPATLTSLSWGFPSYAYNTVEFSGTAADWMAFVNASTYFITLDPNGSIRSVIDNGTFLQPGRYVFNGLELVNLYIPNTISNLKQHAFNYCQTLETVEFESGVSCYVNDYAFRGCKNLRLVNFNSPDSITLSERVFQNCAITSLYIPAANSFSMYGNSFSGCPIATIEVDPLQLYYRTDVCNCLIGQRSNEYSDFLYLGCSSSVLPDTGKKYVIGSQAFSGITKLTSLKSSKIANIDSYNFSECTDLIEVDFTGSSFLSSPYQAFYGCKALEKVVFPKTLTSLGQQQFLYCPSLKAIYLLNLTSVVNIYTDGWYKTFNFDPYQHIDVYVKSELISAYQNDSKWSQYSDYITFKAATDAELGIDYEDLEPDYSTLYVGMTPVIYGIKENGERIKLDNSIDLTFSPALTNGTFGSDGDYTITLTGTTLSVDYYVEPEEEPEE